MINLQHLTLNTEWSHYQIYGYNKSNLFSWRRGSDYQLFYQRDEMHNFRQMQSSSKVSLMTLQQHIQKQLKTMPKSPLLQRHSSLNLRHTVGSSPQLQLKYVLHRIRSLKTCELESSHKRQSSLTSTRIPEPSPSATLKNVGSADRLDRKKELRQLKSGEKTKLKKKLSSQESPKPFLKLNRGQTLRDGMILNVSPDRPRKQFTKKPGVKEQIKQLSPQEYQKIIQNQKQLIAKLENIIESMEDG